MDVFCNPINIIIINSITNDGIKNDNIKNVNTLLDNILLDKVRHENVDAEIISYFFDHVIMNIFSTITSALMATGGNILFDRQFIQDANIFIGEIQRQ